MKKTKRILALTMALAMAFSLFSFNALAASGEEFTTAKIRGIDITEFSSTPLTHEADNLTLTAALNNAKVTVKLPALNAADTTNTGVFETLFAVGNADSVFVDRLPASDYAGWISGGDSSDDLNGTMPLTVAFEDGDVITVKIVCDSEGSITIYAFEIEIEYGTLLTATGAFEALLPALNAGRKLDASLNTIVPVALSLEEDAQGEGKAAVTFTINEDTTEDDDGDFEAEVLLLKAAQAGDSEAINTNKGYAAPFTSGSEVENGDVILIKVADNGATTWWYAIRVTVTAQASPVTDNVVPGDTELQGEMDVLNPILAVVLPSNLNFALDPVQATVGEEGLRNQIKAVDFFMVNRSGVPVSIDLTIEAALEDGVSFVDSKASLNQINAPGVTKDLYMGILGANAVAELTEINFGTVLTVDGENFVYDPDVPNTLRLFDTEEKDASMSFVLSAATGDPDKLLGTQSILAEGDRGVSSFTLYGHINTYAAWRPNDITITGIYKIGAMSTFDVPDEGDLAGLNIVPGVPGAPGGPVPSANEYSFIVAQSANQSRINITATGSSHPVIFPTSTAGYTIRYKATEASEFVSSAVTSLDFQPAETVRLVYPDILRTGGWAVLEIVFRNGNDIITITATKDGPATAMGGNVTSVATAVVAPASP